MPVFTFDNTYLSLPELFYSRETPTAFTSPELVLFNSALAEALDMSTDSPEAFLSVFYGEPSQREFTPFAQAYAGHQYGHFTRLGDGRAIIIGEHLTKDKRRWDIQLKGSGRTAYSRRGDGKATLRAMLREYLISEAMMNLGIPTSRSLAVFKTGETVFRETIQPGAAVVRVMTSHIRVGTFEFAARFGSLDDLSALTRYTIHRLYPDTAAEENPPLAFLRRVIRQQVELVVNWIRVGFIHGVMNTDNTAISGETFDYGPCAFLNAFDPKTVYSSIDHHGRYAFGNQPNIIKWNLARFAESVIALLHPEKENAVALAQEAINEFDTLWQETYYSVMLKKIGIETPTAAHRDLLNEWLDLLNRLKLDYTNTFYALRNEAFFESHLSVNPDLQPWLEKWRGVIAQGVGLNRAREIMATVNPALIPRNHRVEAALDAAERGQFGEFNDLSTALSTPYLFSPGSEKYMQPSEQLFDEGYQTFCGT